MSVIITSVLVMAAAVLIRKAFSGKLSGKALMVIWAIVFVKLAIPVSVPAAFSVMNLFAEKPVRADIAADADHTVLTASDVSTQTVYMPSEDETPDSGAYDTDIEEEPAETAPAGQKNAVIRVSFREIVNTAYVIITVVLEAGVIIAYAVCAVQFATFEDIEVPGKFAEKGIRFRRGDVGTPAVFGIFRPVILFPRGTNVSDSATFEHIILHEKTHIRHRDQLFNLLTLFICCLNWYDPLAWICRALYLKDVEKWCDESVIKHIGKANKKAYAESLLACAAERSSSFALVSGFGENDIKGRIKSMMYDKKFKRGASAAVVTLTAILFAAFGTGASAAVTKEAANDPDVPAAGAESASDISAASTDEPAEENPEPGQILRSFIGSHINRLNIFGETDCALITNRTNLLDPLTSAETWFSIPFRIPVYSAKENERPEPEKNIWYSALMQNGKPCALMEMSYDPTIPFDPVISDAVVGRRILYLPYEFTESIANGGEISLFLVRSEAGGGDKLIFCGIDKSGKSGTVAIGLHDDPEISDKLEIETTKADYDKISRFNIISKDMDLLRAFIDNNMYSTDIEDGGRIKLGNFAEQYSDGGELKYKSLISYIVHEAGKDGNGEMMYTLSPKKAPEKTVRLAGSEKVYLRCADGGTATLYMICPVNDTGKALTLVDGKLKVKKWTGASEQLWRISIADK